MTHDTFKRLITSKEYDFVRKNSHLGKNIMLLLAVVMLMEQM